MLPPAPVIHPIRCASPRLPSNTAPHSRNSSGWTNSLIHQRRVSCRAGSCCDRASLDAFESGAIGGTAGSMPSSGPPVCSAFDAFMAVSEWLCDGCGVTECATGLGRQTGKCPEADAEFRRSGASRGQGESCARSGSSGRARSASGREQPSAQAWRVSSQDVRRLTIGDCAVQSRWSARRPLRYSLCDRRLAHESRVALAEPRDSHHQPSTGKRAFPLAPCSTIGSASQPSYNSNTNGQTPDRLLARCNRRQREQCL